MASVFQQWDALRDSSCKVFDIPAGRLAGDGAFATLTVQSTRGLRERPSIQTAIEQFDLQDDQHSMWGYGEGWQEAEYNPQLGVWRWTSDRSTLRIVGPPRAVRVTMTIESPLALLRRAADRARARRRSRNRRSRRLHPTRDWTFDVPADALAASGGVVTIETDKTFVPAERGSARRSTALGTARVLAIRVV